MFPPARWILLFIVSGFLLLGPAVSPAAEEPFASYPLLPSGYTSIRVFDRDGRFAGRILPEGRYWVPIERIPAFLQNAVVAIEDARFYEHSGIDLRGIARALVKDAVQRRLAEGGSTITQQLIKNKHLTAEKTIDRKVKEGILAMEYERKYTKKQILEMYLNEIYFGKGAWGIAQAARLYFDKNPEELTDAESAVLAGVPKNPGRYNPLGKPSDVAMRRNVVLKRMAELGMITPQQEKKLRSQPVKAVQPGQAAQYLAHIRRKLIERYGADVVDQGGLDVTAGMDLNLQNLAEKVLGEGVKRISPDLQGALLSIDPNTGDLLAIAGGVDASQSTFNRALFARRQPGSAIKPLIYAAAVDVGITAGSRWDDEPATYDRGNGKTWKPLNYGGESFGESTLREALARSSNVVTVKLLDTIGVPYFLDFARKLGLSLRTPNDLSLALGTDEVTLHDLTLAYTPLATGGVRPESRTIIRVQDRRGSLRGETPPALTAALSAETAFVTTWMLKDVLTSGSAKSLKRFAGERPAAGKTGTTDDYRDAWFIGYTPQMVTGVWVGYDTPKPGGRGFTGGAVAAPIWERFMRPALAGEPADDFARPEAVAAMAIDPATGYLATADCPEAQDEYFVAGTEPTEPCPEHKLLFVGPLPPPETEQEEFAGPSVPTE